MIHLLFGPQGAGKSTIARQLAEQFRAVRFSIADWMGALLAPGMPQPLNLRWIMARVQRNQDRGDTYAFEVTPAMFGLMETQFESPDAHELAGCSVTETA